jgi:hypothetical protein
MTDSPDTASLARRHRLWLAGQPCVCEPGDCDDTECLHCRALDPYDPCPAEPAEDDG